METLMIGMVAITVIVSLRDWRQGIYLAVVIDAFRDVIRKMAAEQPVWISQAIIIVWAAIFVSCVSQQIQTRRDFWRTFPRLKQAAVLLFIALVPGAVMSLLLYRNGWILVAIGGVSYLGPLAGAFIGVCLANNPGHVYRFMKIFVILNSVVLVGGIAEWSQWGWPGLGGLLGHDWIRHMPGVLVRLVSGFYRSPDIAGFHAAHVVIFSCLLVLPTRKGGGIKPLWFFSALWGLFALILTGRRKMFALPVAFLIVWAIVEVTRRQRNTKSQLLFIGVSYALFAAGAFYLIQGDDELADHQIYLATTIFDVAPNLYNHAFQGSITTLSQSGVLGSGLGIATQGAQYSGVSRSKAWQEDGVSRIFKELGLVGAVFLAIAILMIFRELRRALRFRMQWSARNSLQNGGVAIAAANLACFVMSHQHISGDPANGILPLLFFGGVWGHVVAEQRQARGHAATIAREPNGG
jgi:hypothetical protein